MEIKRFHHYPFSFSNYNGEKYKSIAIIKNDKTGHIETFYSDMGKGLEPVNHTYWVTDLESYLLPA